MYGGGGGGRTLSKIYQNVKKLVLRTRDTMEPVERLKYSLSGKAAKREWRERKRNRVWHFG